MRVDGIFYTVLAACAASTVAATACSVSSEETELGTASLPLTAVGADGTEFRLNTASFTISGPTSTTVASGEEAALDVELTPGNYTIELADGWQMLATIDGVPTPVEAELLSPNPQVFTIEDGATTDIVFRFGVDGELVELGNGTARIRIEVDELTADAGPCDIYSAAGTPCVAAYSMVRTLSRTYTGPLYQVRTESSAQNTGTGGQLYDIPSKSNGFADTAIQDTVCAGTICTVSVLYDQSGNGNDLTVAPAGNPSGGATAALDDFEAVANAGPLTVDGNPVYSLYTTARQGYRLTSVGAGMPTGNAPQGIYMLANGERSGTACCFDFGNVVTDPTTYGVANALFLGTAYWGRGAGTGPWFLADFEAGLWAGGSLAGDPGWGALDSVGPPNPQNPSLRVPFALGFLKTNQTNYSLRMANAATGGGVVTAYSGALPKQMNSEGGIVLGVGPDNSNNSWGTFYEGAILSGYPTDAAELQVLQNIQGAGYEL